MIAALSIDVLKGTPRAFDQGNCFGYSRILTANCSLTRYPPQSASPWAANGCLSSQSFAGLKRVPIRDKRYSLAHSHSLTNSHSPTHSLTHPPTHLPALPESHKNCSRVQDPYTMRCVPQVHGVVHDTLSFVRGILSTEMNSATDNPVSIPCNHSHTHTHTHTHTHSSSTGGV